MSPDIDSRRVSVDARVFELVHVTQGPFPDQVGRGKAKGFRQSFETLAGLLIEQFRGNVGTQMTWIINRSSNGWSKRRLAHGVF